MPKFLVTKECGRLARWLRLMGYDTVLSPAYPLPELYRRAYNERRVVLTRNARVGASGLFRVVHLASPLLEEQLRQLGQTVELPIDDDRLFTRCDLCNVPVEFIDKARVHGRVPPYVHQTQQRFYTCPSCRRIYWAATHWQRARVLFDRLRRRPHA